MKEDRYIEQLLEAARNEPSGISFGEVAARFEETLEEVSNPPRGSGFTSLFTLNGLMLFLLAGAVIWIGVIRIDNKQIKAELPRPASVDILPEESPGRNQPSKITGSMPASPQVVENLVTNSNTSEVELKLLPATLSLEKIDPDGLQPLLYLDHLPKKESEVLPVSEATFDFGKLPAEARLRFYPVKNQEEERPPPAKIMHSIGLVLLHGDREEAVLGFVATLESYGLEMSFSSPSLEKKGSLDHFVMKFQHPKGMDFKLKSTGFKRFEIHLQLDAKQVLQGFKYRFNDENFTDLVPLICRGHKRHIYGDGHQLIGGTTNVCRSATDRLR